MLLPDIKLPISPELAAWAKWRVWVADVRDQKEIHHSVPIEVAEYARILASMMDVYDKLSKREGAPTNMLVPLEGSVLAMFGWLLLKGVSVPN